MAVEGNLFELHCVQQLIKELLLVLEIHASLLQQLLHLMALETVQHRRCYSQVLSQSMRNERAPFFGRAVLQEERVQENEGLEKVAADVDEEEDGLQKQKRRRREDAKRKQGLLQLLPLLLLLCVAVPWGAAAAWVSCAWLSFWIFSHLLSLSWSIELVHWFRGLSPSHDCHRTCLAAAAPPCSRHCC